MQRKWCPRHEIIQSGALVQTFEGDSDLPIIKDFLKHASATPPPPPPALNKVSQADHVGPDFADGPIGHWKCAVLPLLCTDGTGILQDKEKSSIKSQSSTA